MASLFGPSASDLEHLRSAVRALGTTSIPGLCAALSWRERKTEKLLAHELARPNSSIVYDPARRTVRWALAPPPVSAPPLSAPAPPAPASAPRAPSSPTPVFTPAGLKVLCPHCRVALQSTGSNGLVVCPDCGRLSSARTSVSTAPAPVPDAPSAPPVAPRAAPTPAAVNDRKSQELFAAWVTNQPIPCPKCRTSLRHLGIRVYGCPSCGQQVRFPAPGAEGAPTPPVEPLPAR